MGRARDLSWTVPGQRGVPSGCSLLATSLVAACLSVFTAVQWHVHAFNGCPRNAACFVAARWKPRVSRLVHWLLAGATWLTAAWSLQILCVRDVQDVEAAAALYASVPQGGFGVRLRGSGLGLGLRVNGRGGRGGWRGEGGRGLWLKGPGSRVQRSRGPGALSP
eukprot:2040845-Rhodomonas_salina.2